MFLWVTLVPGAPVVSSTPDGLLNRPGLHCSPLSIGEGLLGWVVATRALAGGYLDLDWR